MQWQPHITRVAYWLNSTISIHKYSTITARIPSAHIPTINTRKKTIPNALPTASNNIIVYLRIIMTFCSLGGMTRYVRASMIDALHMDCVRTARAKGLNERLVVRSHAWRNALIPIVSIAVGWLVGIFSGSIMIENIFGINGIGKVYFDALTANDNEIALAMQMFYIFLALVGNLFVDIAYGLIDPRIRLGK